jgi:hypothetical protein
MKFLSEKGWYCTICRSFLPIHKFKAGPKRWICKRHCGEKWVIAKMKLWDKYPQQKQARIAWQLAYRDSVTLFLLKIAITPAQVLLLLQDQNIPVKTGVRLLPLAPKMPLSIDNCFLASLAIRRVMCRIWKQFRCTREYDSAHSHYQAE